MIEKIPNIDFKRGKLPEVGFEIVELASLYTIGYHPETQALRIGPIA